MNSKAVYTEPVNRIKQRILFDDNLDNLSTLCPTWEDLFDVHTILGETKQDYERKLEIAQAKQPKAEW